MCISNRNITSNINRNRVNIMNNTSIINKRIRNLKNLLKIIRNYVLFRSDLDQGSLLKNLEFELITNFIPKAF